MYSRIINTLSDLREALEEGDYVLNRVLDTGEIETSGRFVKGRLQTARTAILKAISATNDAIDGYRAVLRDEERTATCK